MDQVVCIHDGPWASFTEDGLLPINTPCPVKGGIYTIVKAPPAPNWHPTVRRGYQFAEIPNPNGLADSMWADYLFRPVKPTSIESLRKLLAPTKSPAKGGIYRLFRRREEA